MPTPKPGSESQDEWMSRCTDHEDIPDGQEGVDKCLAMWSSSTEKSDDTGGFMKFLPDWMTGDDDDVEKRHVNLDSMTEEQAKAAFGNMSAAVDRIVTRGKKAVLEMRANDVEVPDNLLSRIVRTFSGGKIASIDHEEEDEMLSFPEGVEKGDTVEPTGPRNARVAFVGAYPSQLDNIRKRHFSGPVGKTLRESYLEKLGVEMEDTLRFNVIPVYDAEFTKSGNPEDEVVEKWGEYVDSVLDEYEPQTVVALGKTAKSVLGDRADEWVPHPRAVQMHGESDELDRKLGRMLDKVEKTEEPVREGGGLPVEPVAKNEEKQVVYGILLRNQKEDADGNWTTKSEIEDAIHYYMKNHVHEVDHEHYRDIEDGVSVVEAWTAKTDFELGSRQVNEGDGLIGVHIEDPRRWEKVKKGEYRGFSFAGSAEIDPDKRLSDE